MMQVVDPAVSRTKFDAEIARFEAHRSSYTKRGWWLMKAEFPIAEMAFVTTNLRPAMLALTARFDFTDFDLMPLSVTFIDPFTGAELLGAQLMTRMKRQNSGDLIQVYPGEPGFICLPGVREYHEHPAHSGDAWELHRASGEGFMLQIAEKIWQYGSNPIDSIGFQIQQAFQQSTVPA
jgi:hypothetical protein